MLAGVGAKPGKGLDGAVGGLEIWACGCTVVGSLAPVNIRCVTCGNILKKMNSRSKMPGNKQVKTENAKIELVNKIQTLIAETGDAVLCQRCDNSGEIKVFTQEWDRIKSHAAPCPVCRSREWTDWSADRRVLKEKSY